MCFGSFGVVGLEWYPCFRLKHVKDWNKLASDIKLVFYSSASMFSFGYFPSVWGLNADVSEPSIGSIFLGRWRKNTTRKHAVSAQGHAAKYLDPAWLKNHTNEPRFWASRKGCWLQLPSRPSESSLPRHFRLLWALHHSSLNCNPHTANTSQVQALRKISHGTLNSIKFRPFADRAAQ